MVSVYSVVILLSHEVVFLQSGHLEPIFCVTIHTLVEPVLSLISGNVVSIAPILF